MNDVIHILLAVALIALFLRTEELNQYLVGVMGVSFPIIDHFFITPLIELGYIGGPLWIHRSITHSFLAGAIFVAIFYYLGYEKPALIGYSAHLVPDYFMGGVKPFLPFNPTTYGFQLPKYITALVALFSGTIILWAFLSNRYRLKPEIIKKK
ncbi:hypothetical protein C9439_03920 [archaeon SCG-AAA382B04]|nr:hypothetical protein C9439_03920 [archaeon SCG-AAA382B04]